MENQDAQSIVEYLTIKFVSEAFQAFRDLPGDEYFSAMAALSMNISATSLNIASSLATKEEFQNLIDLWCDDLTARILTKKGVKIVSLGSDSGHKSTLS